MLNHHTPPLPPVTLRMTGKNPCHPGHSGNWDGSLQPEDSCFFQLFADPRPGVPLWRGFNPGRVDPEKCDLGLNRLCYTSLQSFYGEIHYRYTDQLS